MVLYIGFTSYNHFPPLEDVYFVYYVKKKLQYFEFHWYLKTGNFDNFIWKNRQITEETNSNFYICMFVIYFVPCQAIGRILYNRLMYSQTLHSCCCPDLKVVVNGWILFCLMICRNLCEASWGSDFTGTQMNNLSGATVCYIRSIVLLLLLMAMLVALSLESCWLNCVWIFTAAFWLISIWLCDIQVIKVYGLVLHTVKAKY